MGFSSSALLAVQSDLGFVRGRLSANMPERGTRQNMGLQKNLDVFEQTPFVVDFF